jgi:hypothetical protein
MKDPMREHIGTQVDTIATKLVEGFWQHVEECQKANPQMTDPHIIFQGWAIQKIAALQGLTLNLVQRVSELENGRKKQ